MAVIVAEAEAEAEMMVHIIMLKQDINAASAQINDIVAFLRLVLDRSILLVVVPVPVLVPVAILDFLDFEQAVVLVHHSVSCFVRLVYL